MSDMWRWALMSIRLEYVPLFVLSGITVGVIAKYFYDYTVRYFKASDRRKVKWDSKGFGLTVGLSFIMAFLLYGFTFERVQKVTDEMLAFTIAFQVGFFSQSIIGELGKTFKEE